MNQVLPSDKDKFVKFKNYKKMVKSPFVIYADIESILEKIQVFKGDKSELYQNHQAASISYYIVS